MFEIDLKNNLSKPELYEEILLFLKGITTDEKDALAILANTASLLFFGLPEVNWAGFYRANRKELVLGPFQGKPACIRIPYGQGVCGTAFAEKKSQVISDVNAFTGHIACDKASKSEIVLPVVLQGTVMAVLDIDSPVINRFDEDDLQGLSKIAGYLGKILDQQNAFWSLP